VQHGEFDQAESRVIATVLGWAMLIETDDRWTRGAYVSSIYWLDDQDFTVPTQILLRLTAELSPGDFVEIESYETLLSMLQERAERTDTEDAPLRSRGTADWYVRLVRGMVSESRRERQIWRQLAITWLASDPGDDPESDALAAVLGWVSALSEDALDNRLGRNRGDGERDPQPGRPRFRS
jgi:hypothetical protein